MANLLQETKFILNKYNIKANKKLGQNFLIEEEVVEAIIGKARCYKRRFNNRNRSGFRNTNTKIARKSRKSSMY